MTPKKIPLSQGKFALVDAEDFEYLSQWKWCYKGGYAARFPRIGKTSRTILMHRFIMTTPVGMETDHVNGDKLDNRKANLRVCDSSQNKMNIKTRKHNTSGHTGVSWDKFNNKWLVQITAYGKRKTIGRFNNKDQAIQIYTSEASKIFGEFVL